MKNKDKNIALQQVFASQDLKADLTCPECGKSRQNDISKFQNLPGKITLKCSCSCGHTFHIQLERRSHTRRPVLLQGTLTHGRQVYPVNITDISRNGLLAKIPELPEIKPGTCVKLCFKLDDASGSDVKKDVMVRNIRKGSIGVEFTAQDHFDKLGPYLLFHF